jgi:hypothetical protein
MALMRLRQPGEHRHAQPLQSVVQDMSWHLAPCPSCGALNGLTATPCWACDSKLEYRASGFTHLLVADHDGDAVLPSAAASEGAAPSVLPALPAGAKASRRQYLRWVVGSMVLAALAVSGFLAGRQRSTPDSLRPETTPSAAAVDRDPVAHDDAKKDAADESVEVSSRATLSSRVPPADEARGTARNAGANQHVLKPRGDASTVAAAAKRQKTTTAARVESQPPGLGTCVEATAALGLCTMSERQPPRHRPCTEAIAALGLCPPETTQAGH